MLVLLLVAHVCEHSIVQRRGRAGLGYAQASNIFTIIVGSSLQQVLALLNVSTEFQRELTQSCDPSAKPEPAESQRARLLEAGLKSAAAQTVRQSESVSRGKRHEKQLLTHNRKAVCLRQRFFIPRACIGGSSASS